MMSAARAIICGLLVLLVSVIPALAAQSVTTVGRAEIIGSNKDGARNNALANAFRAAVEKGIGVWVSSQTEVKDAALVRDQILTHAQGYVTNHEIIKEKVEGNVLTVTINAEVSVDKIGADIKSLVARVSTAMQNPSITFVLTTWEKKGMQATASKTNSTDVSVKGETKSSPDLPEGAPSQIDSVAVETSHKVTQSTSSYKIDEDLWVKYPDTTIIDSFNQEFKDKGFNLNAGDKARTIALSKSVKDTFVNPFDRIAVRSAAAKEGVNFVARGEVKMLDTLISSSTGNTEVTSEIGVEIIDVGSGKIVAAYKNTATAGSRRPQEAKPQSIKKVAVLAARTLAGQTIETWQDASLNGREFEVEFRNIKSTRSQERPILNALEALGTLSSTSNTDKSTLLVKIRFKGQKKALEDGILDQLGSKPGFSESEFDGPKTIEGKIVFKFLK